MTLDLLLSGDVLRYGSAVIAVGVFFVLVVALVRYGHELTQAWFRVIGAVTLQQAVTSYVYVVRARSTPPGFPDRIDLSLAGLLISGITLLVCALGVFAARRDG